jgi:hypothetical protein
MNFIEITVYMKYSFGISRRKKRKIFSHGHTFIEVIIALSITVFFSNLFMQGIGSAGRIIYRIREGYRVQVKISHVFSFILPQILNTGLGISPSENFTELFKDIPSISYWKSPLQIVPNKAATCMSKDWGNELRCLYAIPSRIQVVEVVPSQHRVKLSVSPNRNKVEPTFGGRAMRTVNWIIFPGASRPFRVVNLSGRILTLAEDSQDIQTIPIGSSLHFLRAARFYVKNGPRRKKDALYFHDVTKQSTQPVINGISKILFTYDRQRRVLEVCVKVQSKENHGVESSKIKTGLYLRNM